MLRLIHVGPALLVAVLSADGISAAPFRNGSFEANGGNGSSVAEGWHFSSGNGTSGGVAVINQSASGPGYFDEGATDGDFIVAFNPGATWYGGTISQTIDTVAGATYSVEFDYGNFGGFGVAQSVSVRVRAGEEFDAGEDLVHPDSVRVLGSNEWRMSSQVLIAQDSFGWGATRGPAPNSEFAAYRFEFTAISGSSTIVFQDTAVNAGGVPFGNDGVLDNVRVALVAAACSADFNLDGFLDFTDFDDFVLAFEGGDSAADFNHDGFLDFTDFDAFVGVFEVGC